MELGLAAGEQQDLESALLRLGYRGAIDLHLSLIGRGVLDFDLSLAAELDAVMEDSAVIQTACPEARTWVVNLKELDRAAGSIFDCSLDVIGVASRQSRRNGYGTQKRPDPKQDA
jgi:hypothetical protein